jgi:conjugal transfer/entry exclusion protein
LACRGQVVPPAIRKKFAKACQAVAQLATGTPKQQKKLQRAAEGNLRKARALATKAGKRKISGDCARAIVDRLN